LPPVEQRQASDDALPGEPQAIADLKQSSLILDDEAVVLRADNYSDFDGASSLVRKPDRAAIF
jgi:hypothetical protein